VSNLPQLQAAGHADAEGRLVKAVVVRRLPTLPAPRRGAPAPLVRVRLRCRRCVSGAPTRRCVLWVRRCRWAASMWAWRWRRRGTSGTRRRACAVSWALWVRMRQLSWFRTILRLWAWLRSPVQGCKWAESHSGEGVGLPVQPAPPCQDGQVVRQDHAAWGECVHQAPQARVAGGGGPGVAAGALVLPHGPAPQPLRQQRGSAGGAGPRGRGGRANGGGDGDAVGAVAFGWPAWQGGGRR
jgi:hypothetical protein